MRACKKMLALLLTLLMTLSVFAMRAAAGGDETIIKEVIVSGNVVPKVGESTSASGVKLSSGVNLDDVGWLIEKADGSQSLPGATFVLGVKYILFIEFTVKDGYQMDPAVKAFVKTEEATLVKEDASTFILTYTYPPLQNETVLKKVTVTDITEPYADNRIYVATAKITKGATLLDIAWYKEGMPGDFKRLEGALNKFEKGEVYALSVGFKADFCYSIPIGTPFEVFGKTVEIEKPVDGYYNVWVEFPPIEAKTLTVTFDASPGLVSPTTKQVSYLEPYGTLPIPHSSGRTFLGWYLGNNKITSTSVVTKTENHVLTAKWQMNNLVTFDPNGGTVSPTSKSFVCGEAFGELPTPTRSGYTFLWWVDENNIVVEPTTIVPNQLNMKLTAKWSKNSASYISVNFDANGGKVSPTTATFELGAPYGDLPVPTRDGYVFKGWYDAENNLIGKTTIVAGLNNQKLTAKWEKVSAGHTEHTYDAGVVTKNPTCIETGVKTYSCTGCEAKKTEILPMVAHSYKNTVKAATLKKDGKVVKACTVCGAVASSKKVRRIASLTLSATEFVYNKKAKKPTVTVLDSAGKAISSKYYTVKFVNNKNVGAATAKVTFKGIYSGGKNLTFKILPRPTALKKLVAAEKAFKATWAEQSLQTTGYQLQYATDKKFTKNVKTLTIKDNTVTARVVKKLTAGKPYYVRIRTYQTAGGKNYFSAWSKALKVTTK